MWGCTPSRRCLGCSLEPLNRLLPVGPLVPGNIAVDVLEAVEAALDNDFVEVIFSYRYHIDEDGVLCSMPFFVDILPLIMCSVELPLASSTAAIIARYQQGCGHP